MGNIFSRFRKKKTAVQELESLEKDILTIEEYLKITELKERRVVGNLVLYSVLVYFMVAVIYYMCFASKPVRENFLYFIPLVIYPVVILLLKRLMTWYYRRKTEGNAEKLLELKSSKKKILDDVMDKETYKTAKEILEKYAPEQLNRTIVPVDKARMKLSSPVNHNQSRALSNRSSSPKTALVPMREMLNNAEEPIYEAIPNVSFQSQLCQPKLPLVRPILARERTPFDKLVDLLIGDGPNTRYALICRTCCAHNGMALKHEFEYLAFRCAYCLQFNPARKQKPRVPSLSGDVDADDIKLFTLDHVEDAKENETVDRDDRTNTEEEEDVESSEEKYINITEEVSDHDDDDDELKAVDESSVQSKCSSGSVQNENNANFDMSSLRNAIADVQCMDTPYFNDDRFETSAFNKADDKENIEVDDQTVNVNSRVRNSISRDDPIDRETSVA